MIQRANDLTRPGGGNFNRLHWHWHRTQMCGQGYSQFYILTRLRDNILAVTLLSSGLGSVTYASSIEIVRTTGL